MNANIKRDEELDDHPDDTEQFEMLRKRNDTPGAIHFQQQALLRYRINAIVDLTKELRELNKGTSKVAKLQSYLTVVAVVIAALVALPVAAELLKP